MLITIELSRLGRSMLEIIELILDLDKRGVKILFLNQRELGNFENIHSKIILGIYACFAEIERDLISQRTKAGLEKVKEKGIQLGRPFGSFSSFYDKDIEKIKELLKKELTLINIWKLLYKDGGKTYESLLWFCHKRGLIQKRKTKTN